MADEKTLATGASTAPAKQQEGKSESASKQETASAAKPRDLTGAALDEARRTGVQSGTTTEAQAQEYRELNINAALDNRTGDQRPILSPYVKPQQIDGPEVGHFAEHAEQFEGELEKVEGYLIEGDAIGHRAQGPHGRGPHGVTVGDAHGQPLKAEAGAGDVSDPRNPAK